MDDIARLAALFDEALSLPEGRRKDFIAQVVADEPRLGEELSSLLDSHESATGYFEGLSREIVAPGYDVMIGDRKPGELAAELQSHLEGLYEIIDELGGGMSQVFLAKDIRLGREIVLKVLPPQVAAASADRFRREIHVAAQLQHPHIVPLLTSDSAGPFLYYTMPHVAGESLRQRLARNGPLPVRDAVEIWKDILGALAHAHSRRVVHRDIKPANILLADSHAVVTDFGIARAIEAAGGDAQATAPGLVIGTPAYMAPEQVIGDGNVDHRADIYAAGLVMYEMLEGRPPFTGDSARDVALARLSKIPAAISRPDCPRQLGELVSQCLERDPSSRPQSGETILSTLDGMAILSGRRSRGWVKGGAVAATGLVAIALASKLFTNTPAAVATTDSATRPVTSIAVLPLTNLSGATDGDALANGMTEELISVLASPGNLRVMSSTSVSALAGRAISVRQIAESLQVSHVLEGGVQKAGARLRMQVRLVDARDGTTQWSQTYDREMDDIFAVQDEIARAVSRELNVRLSVNPGSPVTRRYTPKIEAYEWYLRGTDVSLTRSAAGRQQALMYLRNAVKADSNFAAAYAAQVRLLVGDAGPNQNVSVELAERMAKKAIELDDSLAEAYAGLGWARMSPGRWKEAEADLRRAIALDPNGPRAHEGLARIYLWTGNRSEQLKFAQTAVQNDPFSHSAIRELALALSMNGRCDEAIERLRPLKQLTPPAGVAGVIMGECYAAKQMWPQAIEEFRWAMENSDAKAALSLLGFALARAGRREEAKAILDDLISGKRDSHQSFGLAVVHAGLGDYDEAFKALEKAVVEDRVRVYIMGPMFDDLRRDARFTKIKTMMGV